MPRRSDAKQRMVTAARELIRERGVGATAFSDVLERSGAPRGSVYFHFPGGKGQLVTEAAASHAHQQVTLIDELAANNGDLGAFVGAYVDAARDGMVTSGFGRGCGIAPLVIEGAHDDQDLLEAARAGFAEMGDRFTHHFVAHGLDRSDARVLADAVLAATEGAMVTSRALRSSDVWTACKDTLAAHVQALTRRR